jgi:hypothetical protein
MKIVDECYERAEQYEQQAESAQSDQARELLLKVAGKWRELADEIKALVNSGLSGHRISCLRGWGSPGVRLRRGRSICAPGIKWYRRGRLPRESLPTIH